MKHLLLLGSLFLFGCGISAPYDASASSSNNDQSKKIDKLKKLELGWQYSLYAPVASTPVVSGNQLLVAAENGNLYSFDLPARKFSWLYHTEAGIASTPTIANGKIYFLSRDGFLRTGASNR